MKKFTQNITSRFTKIFATFLWACAVAFNNAHAALPKMPTPSGGGVGGAAVQDGDWLALMGAYFKQGITMLGLVLAAAAFIAVVIGAMQNWKAYSDGRITLGELKQFMIVGVIVIAFIVLMVSYATEVLA